jgi:hypothetical protein
MAKITVKIKGNLAEVKKAIKNLVPKSSEPTLRSADARARLKKV